ncbi:MAG: TauD/TfdA family dioxygenase, partial [Novosphingobium sp.]|nr:TauD/TfdA family dioxygenase [Novosphingobium sp.]
MTTDYATRLRIEPIKPAVGAVVHADRAMFADPYFAAQCVDLLEKHIALVFPRVGLSDDEQLAFTDMLGERVNFTDTVPGGDLSQQDVYTITLNPEVNTDPEYVLGSMFWHADGIVSDIPPPKYTLLSCRRPPNKDGQTEFCNTVAAWQALPEEEKAELEGLRVVHSIQAALREFMTPDEIDPVKRDMKHEHPLVWTQQSGRKSLLLGIHADYIVGMPKAQSRALLARLTEWAAQPAFTVRHTWQEGDFAMWDN